MCVLPRPLSSAHPGSRQAKTHPVPEEESDWLKGVRVCVPVSDPGGLALGQGSKVS